MAHRGPVQRLDRSLGQPVQRWDREVFEVDQARRVDQPNGMVDAPGVAARAGIQLYPQADGTVVREARPRSVVMDPASIATLRDQYLTNEHPGDGLDDDQGLQEVTPLNARSLFHGHVREVQADTPEPGLLGVVVRLATDEILQEAERGKVELSGGYTTVLLEPTDPAAAALVDELGPEPGVTHDGERYDLIQTEIRYNHLALVGQARAGPVARLRMDSMKLKKFKIDSVEREAPEWIIASMKAQDIPADKRADQGETVEVMIEGMDRPLVLPKEMVDQMLAAIGAGAPAEPAPIEEPVEDLGAGDEEFGEMPRQGGPRADQDGDDEPKKDKAEPTMDSKRIDEIIAARVDARLKTLMPGVVKKTADSVTKQARDRAEIDRAALPVLGARFDYGAHDEHGIALEVLRAAEDPRVSQAEGLATKARKGDAFAAGQLRTLMDLAIDRKRDAQDSTGALVFDIFDNARKDGQTFEDEVPSWTKAAKRRMDTATRRKPAQGA